MCGVQQEKKERVKIVYDDSEDEKENEENEKKDTRSLREAWLNKNFK